MKFAVEIWCFYLADLRSTTDQCRYNLLLGSTDSRYPLLPAPDNLISRWSIGLGKLGIVASCSSSVAGTAGGVAGRDIVDSVLQLEFAVEICS